MALALFGGPAGAQTPAPGDAVISLDNFKDCGLVTRFAPNRLQPECFQGIRNAVLDKDWTILRRNGYAAYNASPCTGSQPVRGLWPFNATDGSQYVVMQSSGSMFYSKGDGTCTPIPGLSGLSTTATMSCVQTLGYLWCDDGIDPVFRTNVTSTATVAAAPVGLYIGAFRNRVVISGVPSNLTSVYLSGELDGTDWNLPTVTYSTSPAILKINGVNDGLGVSCLMGEFQNQYLIGRQYDLWALAGYDLRDFTLRRVSEQVGCMENRSSQEVNNVFYWLSHRGVEGYTGTQIQRASYNIDPTLQVIIAAAGNSQSQTFTSQADWQSGNLTASGPGAPISATISPGNIVPSTWGVSVPFSSYNNVFQVPNGDFTSGNTTGWTASGSWAVLAGGVQAGGSCHGAVTNASQAAYTSCSANATRTLRLDLVDTNGNSVKNCTTTFNCFGGAGCSAASTTCDKYTVAFGDVYMSSANYTNVALKVTDSISGNTLTSAISQSSFVYAGVNFSLVDSGACGGGQSAVGVSACSVVNYSTSGVTTIVYDTGLSTPVWGLFTFNRVSGSTNSVNFKTRVATSAGGTFDALIPDVPGSSITSRNLRFIQANISTASVPGGAVAWGGNLEATFGLAAETTGYYITPCVTAAGNTAWGNLTVNGVTNGGSFVFSMSTSGVSCAQAINAQTANWATVTANSIIPVAVASYTAVRVLFNLDVATETPTINDITVNWNAGASRPPVTSAAYKNAYYLFYTTSQAVGAANDHVLVFDENQKWELYDDINAASAAIYLNTLYTGDSLASGTVFQQDTGNADNSNAFTFSFTTPDLDGGDPIAPKTFKRAYLVLGGPTPTTLTGSISCVYAIDGSSNTYSLGTANLSEAPEQGGYFTAKFPFVASAPTTGQWLNLTCSNTGALGPLRVYAVRLVYTKNDWP